MQGVVRKRIVPFFVYNVALYHALGPQLPLLVGDSPLAQSRHIDEVTIPLLEKVAESQTFPVLSEGQHIEFASNIDNVTDNKVGEIVYFNSTLGLGLASFRLEALKSVDLSSEKVSFEVVGVVNDNNKAADDDYDASPSKNASNEQKAQESDTAGRRVGIVPFTPYWWPKLDSSNGQPVKN